MLKSREITWYPRNAKIARPSLSLCLSIFYPVFKQIIFLSHKTIVLTIDTHKLSDKIAISPLHSVKDVTYG